QDPPRPVTVADADAVDAIEGPPQEVPPAAAGAVRLPSLGDQDLLRLAGVPVLAENAGGPLLGAGGVGRLAALPVAPRRPVPRPGRTGRLRLLEPVVGEPGDAEAGRPVRRVVGEEGRAGVGEVGAGRDGVPAQVHAAAGGGGDRFDGVTLLVARERGGA